MLSIVGSTQIAYYKNLLQVNNMDRNARPLSVLSSVLQTFLQPCADITILASYECRYEISHVIVYLFVDMTI